MSITSLKLEALSSSSCPTLKPSSSPTSSLSSMSSLSLSSNSSKDKQRGLFKTSLCQYFVASGRCQFGARCIYAHGASDLRVHPSNKVSNTLAINDETSSTTSSSDTNTMYKTSLCRNFMSDGICLFGQRCLFAHGYRELKPKPNADNTISAFGITSTEKKRSNIMSRKSNMIWPTISAKTSRPQVKADLFREAFQSLNDNCSSSSGIGESAYLTRNSHHIVRRIPRRRIDENEEELEGNKSQQCA